jgi:glycerophosphoryl diester phosphodiesterase
MKIIGHRGAASLALENTKASLQKAMAEKVVAHDPSLIAALTWKQVKEIELVDGSSLLSLEEALEMLGDFPSVIEIKDHESTTALLDCLNKYPLSNTWIASFNHDELATVRKRDAKLVTYALEHSKPLEIIQNAKAIKSNGIGINFWLINPLTYWLARRAGLGIYVYTLDNPLIAWFINLLYPGVYICTNTPQRLRPRRKRLNHARRP